MADIAEHSNTHSHAAPLAWWRYLLAILGGFFAMNVVPHLINGVSGRAFPSPFADPPGVGLSSPVVNVGWALTNVALAYLFLRLGRVRFDRTASMASLFIGGSVCAVMCAMSFGAAA